MLDKILQNHNSIAILTSKSRPVVLSGYGKT